MKLERDDRAASQVYARFPNRGHDHFRPRADTDRSFQRKLEPVLSLFDAFVDCFLKVPGQHVDRIEIGQECRNSRGMPAQFRDQLGV